MKHPLFFTTPNGVKLKRNKSVQQKHQRWPIQTVICVIVIALITFSIFPLFITVVNSLKLPREIQDNIFALPTSNIFKAISNNYSEAWSYVGDKFFVTIIVALCGATGITFISAALAYILCFKEFYYKNVVFLFFISILLVPSIIGYPVLVPLVKDFLHLDNSYIGFLLPMIGGNQVGGMFLFRTFFSQQPKSLYESARIEGCNDIEIFFKITIPLALPIILYHFVGGFCSVYNNYLWASLLFNESKMTMMPTIQSVTTTLKSMPDKDGVIYAMYMISSIPLFVTTIISMKYFKSGEFAAGMKL